MDADPARDRIFRLEEDRTLLLAAWQALDALDRNAATECHRVTRAPEFARTFARIEEQLTALDTEQSALIAGLQDAESDWKGGSSEGWVCRLFQRKEAICPHHQIPVIGTTLYQRAAAAAEAAGCSLRQLIENALSAHLITRSGKAYLELPSKICESCHGTFARKAAEDTYHYRLRRFCDAQCAARARQKTPNREWSDAEIREAVRRLGWRKGAKELGISGALLRRRLRAIRERENRKAA